MTESYSIGVDLGGTNLRIAAYAAGTDFLETVYLPTRLDAGRDRVVRDMCEAIAALSKKNYGGRRLAGVGVGTPGPLELPAGVLRNPPNLHGWDGFQLKSAIESTLGREIEIESDGNLAALAEQKLGAGKTQGIDSLCMLTLGTGVGNGLILDGKIWCGFTGMGGEGGHIIVEPHDGAPCGCGGSGCLEQYASALAVVRLAGELMGTEAPTSSHEVAMLAEEGNKQAIQVFRKVGWSLAIGLTSLINTLNLPLNLIGGGVSEAWDLFAPVMFEELRRRSYVYRLTEPGMREPSRVEPNKTYVQLAELGSTAGLLGACLLPLQAKTTQSESKENTFVA
jgi:glucokinase